MGAGLVSGTYVGSGSSWMWSIRTSCRIQNRHRCCRDFTLLNLDTGYRSCTGVGGKPEHTQTGSELSLVLMGTFQNLRWAGSARPTWDPGAQEVEELPVLGVHDGSLDELHHRVAPVLELGVAPQTEGPCRTEPGHSRVTKQRVVF